MGNNASFNSSDEEKWLDSLLRISQPHLLGDEIAAYLEGTASSFLQTRVETHISNCEDCRDQVEMLSELRMAGPGVNDAQLEKKVRELLGFIPARPSYIVKAAQENKRPSPKIIDVIGKLLFSEFGMIPAGGTVSEWANLRYSEIKECAWTYRENYQQDLIFKFTAFIPQAKTVQIVIGERVWEKSFEPEGKAWIAEIHINAEERKKLQPGDELLIHLIKQ